MKKNKRFRLSNSEEKELNEIFNIAGEKVRLSYVYAVCIIQTFTYIFFKKCTPVEKVNKWFYKVYFLKEYDKELINFYYMDIASSYLKEKFGVDLNLMINILLEKINYAQTFSGSEVFNTLEEYLEYLVNKGLDRKTLDTVYNWIVK